MSFAIVLLLYYILLHVRPPRLNECILRVYKCVFMCSRESRNASGISIAMYVVQCYKIKKQLVNKEE